MKSDHMERFVVLPFSIGCASQSSVSVVATNEPRKPKPDACRSSPPVTSRIERGGGGEEEEEESTTKERMKSTFAFLALPKPNLSSGIHKFIKSIKSLSQVFVYKEEMEDEEKELEIGYPTDVKHVTHIGLDGSTTTNPIKGWEELKGPEVMSFPSISLRQFELAMAAQAHGSLAIDPSSKLS
ncbi:hypothetical protein Tsubulata_016089 [Turnera subulata]|uniref:CRIB domain-containing protein n=1 Tax=Turnera subulata TaxID=218843 RepID=A0A9Q0J7C9_9ROSI|nr:hypothetical protein Tsubulata_016089 [Turnera subulata]